MPNPVINVSKIALPDGTIVEIKDSTARAAIVICLDPVEDGTDVSLVTTGEKYIWTNERATKDVATRNADGLLSSTDKKKLDRIDGITTSKQAEEGGIDLSVVTTGEKYIWSNERASKQVATTSANGLMSSTDKVKLNNLKTVKNVEVTDTGPVNITNKANAKGVTINKSNFLSALCTNGSYLVFPYYSNNLVYAEIRNRSDLSVVTSSVTVSVFYFE